MAFEDHFSAQSADCARFRPRYPAALFDGLVDVAPRAELAWDGAAGNGQAPLLDGLLKVARR